ncbi:MAG: hypothetical protein AAGI34_10375 [Pseudomonadota bacterium]
MSFGADGCSGYVEVKATAGWQSTGQSLGPNQRLRIDDVIGRWTGNVHVDTLHSVEGPTVDVYVAPAGYPLPGADENKLLVRVGSKPSVMPAIGTVFTAGSFGAGGPITFTMNDNGYHDNFGSLWVKFSVLE